MSGKPCLFKGCSSRSMRLLRQLFRSPVCSLLPPPTSLPFTPSPSVFQESKWLDIIHKPGRHLCSCLNKSSLLVKAAAKCSPVKAAEWTKDAILTQFFSRRFLCHCMCNSFREIWITSKSGQSIKRPMLGCMISWAEEPESSLQAQPPASPFYPSYYIPLLNIMLPVVLQE